LNRFEKLLKNVAAGKSINSRSATSELEAAASNAINRARIHAAAIVPDSADFKSEISNLKSSLGSRNGTILTGEMFASFLTEHIDKYNELTGAHLTVLPVPNTYFGGDVAVAGLLSGRDYLNVRNQIKGDFVIIPKHTIKSDEPILIDGMTFYELKAAFPVPIYELDTDGLIAFLS
jgi:NifB/MoaA-like Fe-S oxidoreductase